MIYQGNKVLIFLNDEIKEFGLLTKELKKMKKKY